MPLWPKWRLPEDWTRDEKATHEFWADWHYGFCVLSSPQHVTDYGHREMSYKLVGTALFCAAAEFRILLRR